MIVGYVVAWVSVAWTCPFGLSRAPEFVKQFVCDGDRQIESVYVKDEAEARRRLIEIGPQREEQVLSVDEDGRHKIVPIVWLPHFATGRK